MRKILIVLTALCILSVCAASQDLRDTRLRLSISGGPALPSGYFNTQHSTGAIVTVQANYFVVNFLSLYINNQFGLFGYQPPNLPADVYNHEAEEYKYYSIFGGLQGHLPVWNRLYVSFFGGAGYCVQGTMEDYMIYGRGPGYTYQSKRFNEFREGQFLGVDFGGGIEYRFNRLLAVFVDFRFVQIFTKEQEKDLGKIPPEIYNDPPHAQFWPIRIGIIFRIF